MTHPTKTIAPKDFARAHCGFLIGARQGDTLIIEGRRLRENRTRPVGCPVCGKETDFPVDRHHKIKRHPFEQTLHVAMTGKNPLTK